MKPKKNYRGIVTSIIQKFAAKKIAEVGIRQGLTTRTIIKLFETNIDEYWAIDKWEKTELYPSAHRDYRRVCVWMIRFPALRAVKMQSKQAALMFPSDYFDVVFIDADHSYKAVKKDIRWWFPVIKPGGILCGHDYCKECPGVIEAVDEAFKGKAIILPETIWAVRKKIINVK